ncbi:MAG TPA: redoxin domain-containing protein [Planctomycetes bacterium]|nr:redoxin domain-containing protein [Planctomycetota bacterium]HIK61731.1 redoxin domain-containing protein [Planctomycetota bacterium]
MRLRSTLSIGVTLSLLLPAAPCAAGSGSAGFSSSIAPAVEASDDGDEQMEDLIDEFDERMAKFMEAYRAEEDEAKRQELFTGLYPRPADFAPRFRALANEFKGTQAGAKALVWIATNVYGDTQEATVDELLRDYPDSPLLEEVVPLLANRSDEGSRASLRSLLSESPHRNVRGHACRALALNLRGLSADTEDTDQSKSLMAESRALLMRVQEEFDDVPYYGGTLGAAARGELFESDRLQIGMIAPDIAGADLQGVDFKLSDYRGKVVVIDFWGNW